MCLSLMAGEDANLDGDWQLRQVQQGREGRDIEPKIAWVCSCSNEFTLQPLAFRDELWKGQTVNPQLWGYDGARGFEGQSRVSMPPPRHRQTSYAVLNGRLVLTVDHFS